jgi:hypothetical protein
MADMLAKPDGAEPVFRRERVGSIPTTIMTLFERLCRTITPDSVRG